MASLSDVQVGQKWRVCRNGCDHAADIAIGGWVEIMRIEDGHIYCNGYNADGGKMFDHANNHGSCFQVEHLKELIGGENMMDLYALTNEQAAILPEPEKSMVEAGVLDDRLQLTSIGKAHFDMWLFEMNKAAFGKAMVKKVADTKAEIEAAKKKSK